MKQPENTNYLYFPLASEAGLKSSVTPNLGGDAKTDQETFLLEPVSSENLHNNRSTRNFFFVTYDSDVYSATGVSARQENDRFSPSQDESELSAGFMWHTVKRVSKSYPLLETSVTTFVPKDDNVEIMYVTVRNLSYEELSLTPYAAIPIYGRSADNIRDHRNVTSMLHRIKTTENGVLVRPTMSFDEKGHRINHKTYYVCGFTAKGQGPEGFFPTVEEYIGEGGTFTHPRAVCEKRPGIPASSTSGGREAMGAFCFPNLTLLPGDKAAYIILFGVENEESRIEEICQKYNTEKKVADALAQTKAHWQDKVSVGLKTGDKDFDRFMKWVCFQPFLRRLFGCSFLPHHDYGRGGRGWRDLWQDCLSLLLMEPQDVGKMIEANYGGANATIIGDGSGNFIADRNGIARVWMDHALWPLMTTKLYIDQTGDLDILFKEVPYFKDAQSMRGTGMDTLWSADSGNRQLTDKNEIYTGSILEHLLIEQLGDSVAFTCAYAGNLRDLASLLLLLDSATGNHQAALLEEISILLTDDPAVYDDIDKKHQILEDYSTRCRHTVTGG